MPTIVYIGSEEEVPSVPKNKKSKSATKKAQRKLKKALKCKDIDDMFALVLRAQYELKKAKFLNRIEMKLPKSK